jgi:hypothetical protein
VVSQRGGSVVQPIVLQNLAGRANFYCESARRRESPEGFPEPGTSRGRSSIHKTDQPNTFETDGLTIEDRAEINFFAVEKIPT